MTHHTQPKFVRIWNWLLAAALVGSLLWGGIPPAAAQPLPPAAPQAANRYVSPAGTDVGACTLPTAPCATIQYAIDQAVGGDAVLVATGVYTDMNAYGGLAQIAYITKTVEIVGGYNPAFDAWDPETYPATLDANGQGRAVYAAGNIAPSLTGLLIIHGDAAGLGGVPGMGWDVGGGVFAITATLSVSGCQVISNTAYEGGGIAMVQGDLTVENSSLADNQAVTGSALTILGSQAALRHNTIVENASQQGGSIAVHLQSTATIANNLIARNTESTELAGGLSVIDSQLTLTDNTITENQGAGIYLDHSAATIERNTITKNDPGIFCWYCHHIALVGNRISENGPVYVGGVVFHNSNDLTITGNTISENQANGLFGAGLHLYGVNRGIIANNTIISNTSESQGGGIYLGYSHNFLLSENIIRANSAQFSGGGIHIEFSDTTTLTHNIVSDNEATQYGGGLFLYNSMLMTVDGNSFTANQAGSRGGGIYGANIFVPATFQNTLIADNWAGQTGSGVYGMLTTFVHTTIANNTGGDGSGISRSSVTMSDTILVNQTIGITNSVATLTATLWHNNGQNWAGNGIVTATLNYTGAPAFADAASGDYHLTTASAARDAGVDAGVYADFEGDPRPLGGGFDLGYDEVNPLPVDLGIHKSHNPQRLRPGDPLTFTLAFANYGTLTATQVLITDVLPLEFEIGGVSSNLTITNTGGIPYTWQISPLSPGQQGIITLTGWVGEEVLPGTTFTNTAQITTTRPVTTPTPLNDTAWDVVHINALPLAAGDAYTTSEDTPLSIAAPGLLGNDSDADGDALIAILEISPIAGALDFSSNGAFTYLPPSDFSGVVTFTYHVSDGLDSSASAAVAITITPVNDPPGVNAGSNQSLSEGQTASFQGSFTNPDRARPLAGEHILWLFGDGTSITGTLTPTHTYTDNGIFTASLIVTDAQGTAANDTLLVTVLNTPPELAALPDQQAAIGQAITLTITFTDPGLLDTHNVAIIWGDGLTETFPLAAGMLALDAVHTYGAPGMYTVTITLTDKDGGQDVHTLQITAPPYTLYLPLVRK